MAAFVDVMDKPDAHELADGILDFFVNAGAKEAIVGWVSKSARAVDVRMGGGTARRVLKEGTPARHKLVAVMSSDWDALRELVLEYAAPAVPEPEKDTDAELPEGAPKQPLVIFLEMLAAKEPPTEAALAELAPDLLGQVRTFKEGRRTEVTVAHEPADQADSGHSGDSGEAKKLKRQIRELETALQQKCDAEKKLSRRLGRLKDDIARLEGDLLASREREGRMAHELAALQALSKKEHNSDAGRITHLSSDNRRLAQEVERLKGDLADRDSDIEAATDYVDRLERENLALEAETLRLRQEIDSRLSVADLFSDSPPEEALAALAGISTTIGSLMQFVSSAVDAKREMERQQREAEERAQSERERQAAEYALQSQVEDAWSEHMLGRAEADLARFRDALFRDGTPDHIVIDGHNLVLRRFRPDMERTSRSWLERMVCEMSTELGIDTVLVFDCPEHAKSSSEAICSGVRRHFHSKAEGGADAKIAQIIREFRPDDFTIVVSSDHRHVWADTLTAREEGYNAEPIGVALLHNYLVALDEMGQVIA